MSDRPTTDAHDGRHDAPADDLGEIWNALDVLPRANASIDMAATTLDMAAVTLGQSPPRIGDRGGRPIAWRRWLVPTAAVVASLMAGIVAGRVSAPDPDVKILESLPLVRHLPLLQEAGSVRFLQALAARRSQQPLRMPPELLRDEALEFEAAVDDLRADHAWGSSARPLVEERRAAVATLAGDERDALVRSAAEYLELTASDRRDLAAVAAALADPQREELHAAARLWHLIIAASDPPDRKNIIELDAESRIEWLERRSRFREWMTERRGLQPPGEGGGSPRGPGQLLGPVPAGPPGEGRPRRQGQRGDGGPPGPRGDGGPQGGRGEGRGRGEFRSTPPPPERPAPEPSRAVTRPTERAG